MKYVNESNRIQVTDIDWNNHEECQELGRLAAHECVVAVDTAPTEKRLHEIQTSWGDPSRALIHKYVGEKYLTGSHWRSVLVNLGYISKAVEDYQDGMCRVSYDLNAKGKPTGIFTNGELDWHSDQQSHYESQRIIGLMSLAGSENSQTCFLRTSDMYDALNHEDKSMVDELITVWEWDGGSMSKDLIDSQMELVHYHMVPLSGMECPLKDKTATGREGIKFPSHSFGHFKGMSREESLKFRDHLWSLANKPEYIYTRDWQDGQIVFMDQNITQHARPTNVTAGSKRTMVRMVSHVNKLFENQDPVEYIMFKGEKYPHDVFAKMVDEARKVEVAA
jgi:alpha-ketoglutarate-dependent taurine dioxygenase